MIRGRLILAVLLSSTLAASAMAQRRPSIALYSEENFHGQRILLTTDVSDLRWYGFRDRAKSARLTGGWQLCDKIGFGGTCTTADANIPSLPANTASVRRAQP